MKDTSLIEKYDKWGHMIQLINDNMFYNNR
jgi:hypothetical protein